ncbi:hypothetical protein M409DRAFT_53692 [Zasmidium cellare ATCC 36951]|uniref:Uncharacterized protein n=1 Tax=Zasmidium cellare ATCC 36951 TaxID=1080233 RepID=A0A6A6CKN9_ZASCE|nr:uncharacterized protein M409DRAFT_53692 [Zasmidium cellare ATCC 36951]KAF2167715.1 hypothetical protein M409DRAFT_53692 [Zasmidium cellare ATCC 36951]
MIANAMLATTTTRFVPVAAEVAVSVAVRALAGKLAFQAGRWKSTGQLGLGSWPTSNLPRPRRGQQGKTAGESRETGVAAEAAALLAAAGGRVRATLSNRLVSHKVRVCWRGTLASRGLRYGPGEAGGEVDVSRPRCTTAAAAAAAAGGALQSAESDAVGCAAAAVVVAGCCWLLAAGVCWCSVVNSRFTGVGKRQSR